MIKYGATDFVGACPQRNAYVVPRPYSSPGVIQRISMEGLEFLYVANGKYNPLPAEIDILVPAFSHGAFLEKIPVAEVSDVSVKTSTSASAVKMKRRFVQFGLLNNEQTEKLAHFISYHTIPWEMIREKFFKGNEQGWDAAADA